MNVFSFVFAQAQGAAAPATQTTGSSGLMEMMPMIAIFIGIMYFLMIRPQQKKDKERQALLSSLAKGDRVITMGGICGSIIGLSEKTVVVKISDDPAVKVEFLRQAISRVVSREEEKAEKDKK